MSQRVRQRDSVAKGSNATHITQDGQGWIPQALLALRKQLPQSQNMFQMERFAIEKLTNGEALFTRITRKPVHWKPDHLVDHGASWTGPLQKYRLTKDFLRGCNRSNSKLSDLEVEYGVRLVLLAEQYMAIEQYLWALEIYTEIVRQFPQFAIGYYRVGLLLCTIYATTPNTAGNENKPSDAAKSNGGTKVANNNNVFIDSTSLMRDVAGFFGCAVNLEPTNRQLAGNIDLVLCVVCQIPTGKDVWDVSLFPKTAGEMVCISNILQSSRNAN